MELRRPGEGRGIGRRWWGIVLGIGLWLGGGTGLVAAQTFRVSGVKNMSKEMTLSLEMNYYNPQWASDGHRISFEAIVEKKRQLYVYDLQNIGKGEEPLEIVSRKKRSGGSGPMNPRIQRRPSVDFDLSWPGSKMPYDFVFVGSGRRGSYGLYLQEQEEFYPIAEANEEAPHIQFPDFDLTGRNIVYCRGLEGDLEIREVYYLKSTGKWRERPLVTQEDIVELEPEYSPSTGNLIAFNGSVKGNNDIYVFDRKQKALDRLTNWESVEFCPRWSPDERHIAFLSKASTEAPRSLWIMDADGGNMRELVDYVFENPYFQGLTWHPDGDYIFFIKASKEEYDPICYVNVHTGNVHTLEMDLRTQGNEDVAISLDGRRILFCARGDMGSDRLTWLALYMGHLEKQ